MPGAQPHSCLWGGHPQSSKGSPVVVQAPKSVSRGGREQRRGAELKERLGVKASWKETFLGAQERGQRAVKALIHE